MSRCVWCLWSIREAGFGLRAGFPKLISSVATCGIPCRNLSVWVAIGSPLEAFDDVSLTVHMVQHLLLMSVAPPLILLGAPALPLLRGLPQPIARGVAGPVLRWGPVKRLGQFVTRPGHLLARGNIRLDRMARPRRV